MGSDVGLDARKAEVRRFWEASSCGEVYAEGDTAEDKLRQNGEARYRLEPYIHEFARFCEGSGQDVLEIGVGMGADHLEWTRSGPHHLAGIDHTPRAVSWTAQRLGAFDLKSDLREGDAGNLPFADSSFSTVYSWGVLHHSPDTPRAFLEAHRVLRPGGTLRVMIYHRPSIVGAMLWARYGPPGAQPARDLRPSSGVSRNQRIYRLRSTATSGPIQRLRYPLRCSFGDLLFGEVGQQHASLGLTLARRAWPRALIRRMRMLGLLQ